MNDIIIYISNIRVYVYDFDAVTNVKSGIELSLYLSKEKKKNIVLIVDSEHETYSTKHIKNLNFFNHSRLKTQFKQSLQKKSMLSAFYGRSIKSKFFFLGASSTKHEFIKDVIDRIVVADFKIKSIHCATLMWQNVIKKSTIINDSCIIVYPYDKHKFRCSLYENQKLVNSAVVPTNEISLQTDNFIQNTNIESYSAIKKYSIDCNIDNYNLVKINDLSYDIGNIFTAKDYKSLLSSGISLLSNKSKYMTNSWVLPYMQYRFIKFVYKIAVVLIIILLVYGSIMLVNSNITLKENKVLQKQISYKTYQYRQKLTQVISPSQYTVIDIKNTVQLYEYLDKYGKSQPDIIYKILGVSLKKFSQIRINNIKWRRNPDRVNFDKTTNTVLTVSGIVENKNNTMVSLNNIFLNFVKDLQQHQKVTNTIILQQPFRTKSGIISNSNSAKIFNFSLDVIIE
ncbi:MAG: hypothetical protein DRQ51_08095 [Gammaproteobacteria bacterium]|nr:MAG: hypothetical protein DRQ51_08095 [Gammaproteobacteria bacterium]